MNPPSSAVLSDLPARDELNILPESFVLQRIDDIQESLGSEDVLRCTLATMRSLEPDEINKPALLQWLEEGVEADDGRWEIRSALRTLARVIQPRSYLEIGTRRGWSLAQVACESPRTRVWSMDMWIQDYGGVPNPGPRFVLDEIARVAPHFGGDIVFLNGNSHDVLPVFLDGIAGPGGTDADLRLLRAHEDRSSKFDIVTVDGDHTAIGAWWDLSDVAPHVALGGAVVFDDLVPRSDEAVTRHEGRHEVPATLTHSLLDVWEHWKRARDDFVFLENLSGLPPIGIAIRTRPARSQGTSKR